ncbi:hypothetical protein [Glycomyces sp. NRRL B-16210]|uniref:hypothetical protein n=1 Tax=Glycomyces sp. NRRL B-16210 TaxID=1463821 RepID=UPI0004C06887|nr:hypothetical protein [Glycomyces sp. NRRL B-16210]
MTYVPPERGDEPAQDQTRQLDVSPAPGGAYPAVGNGVDAQSAQPVDPFAGRPAATIGYAEQETPRDRLLFQFIWEGILVLLTANALFQVYLNRDDIFGAEFDLDAVGPHLTTVTALLLIAAGLGLSLRLGAVNLAVPALPALVVTTPAVFITDNLLVGLGATAAAAAVLAIVFTVLTAVLRLPAWLVGLATLLAIGASFTGLRELSERLNAGEPDSWSNPGALWLFVGAVAVSIAGGLIGLLPAVRDRFSAVKDAIEGTGPRDGKSVFTLLGGTFLALLLGALAGFVPLAFGLVPEGAFGLPVVGSYSVDMNATVWLTPIALIVVFLAGTSPWGRRGGVFATSLAAVAVWALILVWQHLGSTSSDPRLYAELAGVLYVALLLIGLFVSYGLDRLGRPKEVAEPEDPVFSGEMPPYDSPSGGVDDSGLFEPTLPDTSPPR